MAACHKAHLQAYYTFSLPFEWSISRLNVGNALCRLRRIRCPSPLAHSTPLFMAPFKTSRGTQTHSAQPPVPHQHLSL